MSENRIQIGRWIGTPKSREFSSGRQDEILDGLFIAIVHEQSIAPYQAAGISQQALGSGGNGAHFSPNQYMNNAPQASRVDRRHVPVREMIRNKAANKRSKNW